MNWYKKASRTFSEHVRDVINADLNSPIFVTENLEIIDGAHRTCKAFLLNEKIDAIILSNKEINKAYLPENSDYIGQIYRDDNKKEYSVTKLIELYGKRKASQLKPETILKHSKNVWGSQVDVFEVMKEAKKKMEEK